MKRQLPTPLRRGDLLSARLSEARTQYFLSALAGGEEVPERRELATRWQSEDRLRCLADERKVKAPPLRLCKLIIEEE